MATTPLPTPQPFVSMVTSQRSRSLSPRRWGTRRLSSRILPAATALEASCFPVSSDCKNSSFLPHHGQKLISADCRELRPLLLGKMQTGEMRLPRSTNMPNAYRSFLQQILTCARLALLARHLPAIENHCSAPSSLLTRRYFCPAGDSNSATSP